MLRINIEKAMKRARKVQPPNTDIISLKMLPDGQWIAHYIENKFPVKEFERLCFSLLECPLFNHEEV